MVAELASLGVLHNTLIVFTSDNGFSRGALSVKKNAFRYPHSPSGIFRGEKADIYEGGHRVPLVVQWPARIQPRSVNHDPVSLTDFYATFSDLVQQQQQQGRAGTGAQTGGVFVRRELHGEDSFSLLPLLLRKTGSEQSGSSSTHQLSTLSSTSTVPSSTSSASSASASASVYNRSHLVVHSYRGSFAIREGNYLLAFVGGSGGKLRLELYRTVQYRTTEVY